MKDIQNTLCFLLVFFGFFPFRFMLYTNVMKSSTESSFQTRQIGRSHYRFCTLRNKEREELEQAKRVLTLGVLIFSGIPNADSSLVHDSKQDGRKSRNFVHRTRSKGKKSLFINLRDSTLITLHI